jgi:hypothetical protein
MVLTLVLHKGQSPVLTKEIHSLQKVWLHSEVITGVLNKSWQMGQYKLALGGVGNCISSSTKPRPEVTAFATVFSIFLCERPFLNWNSIKTLLLRAIGFCHIFVAVYKVPWVSLR